MSREQNLIDIMFSYDMKCVMWWGVINLMHRDTVEWKLDTLECGEARPAVLKEEYPTQEKSKRDMPICRAHLNQKFMQ